MLMALSVKKHLELIEKRLSRIERDFYKYEEHESSSPTRRKALIRKWKKELNRLQGKQVIGLAKAIQVRNRISELKSLIQKAKKE